MTARPIVRVTPSAASTTSPVPARPIAVMPHRSGAWPRAPRSLDTIAIAKLARNTIRRKNAASGSRARCSDSPGGPTGTPSAVAGERRSRGGRHSSMPSPLANGRQEAASGKRQGGGARSHQKQGNGVNGQEQEDRIAHRGQDITAGWSREPVNDQRELQRPMLTDRQRQPAILGIIQDRQPAKWSQGRSSAVPPDAAVAGWAGPVGGRGRRAQRSGGRGILP